MRPEPFIVSLPEELSGRGSSRITRPWEISRSAWERIPLLNVGDFDDEDKYSELPLKPGEQVLGDPKDP